MFNVYTRFYDIKNNFFLEYLIGMKSAAQFLGNAVSGHQDNQEVVWNTIIPVLG